MSEAPPPYQQPYPPQQQQGYPPQQQQGYPPQPQPVQQQTTVVVTKQAISPVVFRDVPVVLTDASGNQYTTQLDYRPGTMTWIVVLVLIFFGFWCCACIPLCMDGFKDVYHINPNDGTVVGVYNRA